MRDWNQGEDAAPGSFTILADWKAALRKKSRHTNFDQTLDILRSHSFDITRFAGAEGEFLVSKNGVGAVLAALKDEVVIALSPGVLIRGEIARLLDRGYQKFIKTFQYELPATATQLHAIHQFSEELKQLTGLTSLYNESLGTTSDRYQYDRLKGREAVQSAPARPWDQGTSGQSDH